MSGVAETKYLFTGQEYDPESELYYYNARYYNPRLGRFISRDRVLGRDGDILSRNGYIYVKNNPLKYVDPTGDFEEECSLCKKDLYWEQGPKSFSDHVGDVGNFFNDVADYNYNNPGDNFLFKGMSYGGAFIADMIGDTFNNVSTLVDSHTDRWEKADAGFWVGLDVFAFKGGSVVKKGIAEVAEKSILKVIGEVPKPKVVDKILQNNYINQLFKDSDSLIGGTATAVRNEILSGLPTKGKFHIEKAKNMVTGIGDWIEKNVGTAIGSDINTAKQVMNDLISALGGK